MLYTKRTDTYDIITYQCETEDGGRVDLTGASVNFIMGKKNKLITNAPAQITSAVDGIVSYQLTASDTLVSGQFLGEFEVTFQNGDVKHFPSNGYINVNIADNIDTNNVNVVLDMIAVKQGDFEAKLSSILAQAGNVNMSSIDEYTWNAIANQVTYVFPVTSSYTKNAKWFKVYVGNIPVDDSLISRQAFDNKFELLIDPTLIKEGTKVTAQWMQPMAAIAPTSYKVIPQQDIPPVDAVEGDMWFDTSDDTYQGTVLEGIDTRMTNAETSLAESTSKLSGFVSLAEYDNAKVVASGGYDWYPAFQAAFASGKQKVIVPDGTYLTSSEIVVPINVTLELSDKAIIKAIQSMAAVVSTPLTSYPSYGFIRGGTFDCNDLADIGIYLRYVKQFTVRDTNVQNFKVAGYKLGAETAPDFSYEIFLQNFNTSRPNNNPAPVGSVGVLYGNANDSMILNGVIVGAEKGMVVNGGDNHIELVHCWNAPIHGAMKTCFEVNTPRNLFTNCTADTPTQYGFHVNNYNNHFVQCHLYAGPWGPKDGTHPDGLWNNSMVGFQLENDYNTILSCSFSGTSTTNMLADFAGPGASGNNTILGCQNILVTTTKRNTFRNLGLNEDLNVGTYGNFGTYVKAGSYVQSVSNYLDGANGDGNRALFIRTSGANKWKLGVDGGTGSTDAGLSLTGWNDSGTATQVMWVNRQTMQTEFTGAKVKFAGTWQIPLLLSFYRFWMSADGKVRVKSGDPTSDTDGTPLNFGLSGTTANRPTTGQVYVGMPYFDTTLNKPIWCKTTSPVAWVDSAGTTV